MAPPQAPPPMAPLPQAVHSDVFYRNLHHLYPTADHAEGVYIYDREGKRYLDGSGGAVVVSIGHGVREIAEAATDQISRLAFCHSSQFTSPAQEELARLVAGLSPGGGFRLLALTSGSEGVEAAIKLARQYHIERGHDKKFTVIGRQQSYHGATLGALSVTGDFGRRHNYIPLLLPFEHIAPCHCYRCPFDLSYPSCGIECAKDLERAIADRGSDSVAAFIGEPIVGAAAGATVPPKEYFQQIREICDRHDIVFIVDEVMVGMGRTGKPFAIEHWDVVPDLIIAGKGMASGYTPLAGLLVSPKVYSAVEAGSGKFVHGQTYQGNPLSCAVGAAVIRYLEKHRLIERCARMGEVLFEALEPLRAHPLVGDIRGKGLFAGIEFVRSKKTRTPWPAEIGVARRVTDEAMARGLIVYPGSENTGFKSGDYLLIAPPFIITEEQIGELVTLLRTALDAVYADLQPTP